MPRPRPPGTFSRHPEGHDIDTSSDAILYALFVEAPLHLYHLAILVAALAASLVLQCLILGWIALYFAQVRVFLLSARVLGVAFPDGARLAVGVSGGDVGLEVKRSVAKEQKSDEEVVTARMAKEEAARLRRVKPSVELPATPVDSKVKSATVFKSPGAGRKISNPVVSGVPQITRTLDKLRDAARATGARRTKPAHSFSPLSDLEDEIAAKPKVADHIEPVTDDLLDFAAMAAQELEQNSIKPQPTEQQRLDHTAFVGQQDEQGKQKQESNAPPRPVLCLPDDRPPKPRPSTTSTQGNQAHTQATATLAPPEPKQVLPQPLNRSSAFTQEQLAAAREFMSGATRGNSKASKARSQRKPTAQRSADLVEGRRTDRQNVRLRRDQAKLHQSLRSQKTLPEVSFAPATPVERPSGWVPPHLAAATAKAVNNPSLALEDHLQETKSVEESGRTSEADPDLENVADDHTETESNLPDADMEPWREANGDSVRVELRSADTITESTWVEDRIQDPDSEVEPSVANDRFATTTAAEEAKQTQAVEPEIFYTKQPEAADAHDTLSEPNVDQEPEYAPSEAHSPYHRKPTGCSPSRLRLFVGNDDDGNGRCVTCNKTAVRDQGDMCFPCSTVEVRIGKVKELLAPYSAEAVARKWFPTDKSAATTTRCSSGPSKYDQDKNKSSYEELGNSLVTVEEPEPPKDVYQPQAKYPSNGHPDLSDLQSDLTENVPLFRLPKPTQSAVQTRKLSANALPFFAPTNTDCDNPKLTSATNRSVSYKAEQPTDVHNPYTASFGTFPKTIYESQQPRSPSSLNQSRWAPLNSNNVGQQHLTSGSPRPVVRRAPNVDKLFGPALHKSQTGPPQIPLPNFSPMLKQMSPKTSSGLDTQMHNMSHPTSQQAFAVEGQQPFDVGNMRLPPGLPVPEHVGKSIRVSKAIPIVKAADMGSSNDHATSVLPFGTPGLTAKETQRRGTMHPSMSTEQSGPNANTKAEGAMDKSGRRSIIYQESNLSQATSTTIATRTDLVNKLPSAVLRDRMIVDSTVLLQDGENLRPDPGFATVAPVPGREAEKTKSSAITKPGRLRKMAREATSKALRQRELVRLQLLGSWNLEKAQEFAVATEEYNNRRKELADLMASGELNDDDAANFPELSSKDMSAPKMHATKARNVSARDQPKTASATAVESAATQQHAPGLESSSPETPLLSGSVLTNKDVDEPSFANNSTAAQIECQTKARAAYDLLVTAMNAWTMSNRTCLKCNKKACGDHHAAKGNSRIGPAKTNYRRRREALVQAYGGELPIWLADVLPDLQELELRREKEGCSVM